MGLLPGLLLHYVSVNVTRGTFVVGLGIGRMLLFAGVSNTLLSYCSSLSC